MTYNVFGGTLNPTLLLLSGLVKGDDHPAYTPLEYLFTMASLPVFTC